jgi:hypothetical protein
MRAGSRTFVIAVAALSALASACARSNPLQADAWTPDVGVDADCRVEACNGRDDDCDGRVDEDSDAQCVATGLVGRCELGACTFACADGHTDCDGEPANGCETNTDGDRASCGACGRACGITELCEAGRCRREHIVDFGAGRNVCAVMETGRVLCWGPNDIGGNGDGTTDEHDEPVEVIGVRDAVQISTRTGSCVTTRGGEVWCWGHNRSGVVAHPPSEWEPPTRRADVRGAREVNVLADGCVRLAPDDSVACWGHRVQGEPDPFADIAATAEIVPGLRASRFGGASATHRYAVTLDGTGVMWGTGGQALDFEDPARVWPPREIPGLDRDVVDLTGGSGGQCAIFRGATARCRTSNYAWTELPLTGVRYAHEPDQLAFAEGSLWSWENDLSSLPARPFQMLTRVDLPDTVIEFRDDGYRSVLLPGDRLAHWAVWDPSPRFVPGFE